MKLNSEAKQEYKTHSSTSDDAIVEKAMEILKNRLAKPTGIFFNESDTVKRYCTLKVAQSRNEQFFVLFLSSSHELIADEIICEGTINCNTIYPRAVLERILYHNASTIIICHNHPSGSLVPSPPGLDLTRRLQVALKLFDVNILDHIIVGGMQAVSFSDKGLM